MRQALFAILATAAFTTPMLASVVTYDIDDATNTPTTSANAVGIFFNARTGVFENRLDPNFPNPLFEDGKFFLRTRVNFTPPLAETVVEGLLSRGNDLLAGAGGNPFKFLPGETIAPGPGIFDGVVFTGTGPSFGPFAFGERGYLGLVIGNGTDNANVNYGFAEITVNLDGTITLHSFGYDSITGTAITAPAFTPEPTALAPLLGAGFFAFRRRTR